MNKSELCAAIAENSNLTKADSGRALEAILNAIEAALKAGDSVALVGFGTFSVKDRAERKAQSSIRRGNHYRGGENRVI